MKHVAIFAGLAAASAIAVAAETPEQASYRETKNGEIVFNHYPPRALKAGEQGLVGFALTLDKEGEPVDCKVTHSSGHRLLDRETCALIVTTGVFKPVRDSNGNLVRRFKTQGMVSWQIPGKENQNQVATKMADAKAPERIICRRLERTGSLIAKDRVCKTAREWTRMEAEQKAFVEELQGRKGSTNGGT